MAIKGLPPSSPGVAPRGSGRSAPSRATPDRGSRPQRARRAKEARAVERVQELDVSEKDIRADQAAVEEEVRVGQERARTADLEEEARRHFTRHQENETRADERLRRAKANARKVDADEKRKRRPRTERESDVDEVGDEVSEAARVAARRGFARGDSASRYFENVPVDRLGDLDLTDPNEMQRQLGPSVRFAQHAMLLAHDRMTRGTNRTESIEFLGSLYTGLSDSTYANKALRDFGPATGILDIYPLELLDHLLQHVPGFCQKVRRAPFLSLPSDQERADGENADQKNTVRRDAAQRDTNNLETEDRGTQEYGTQECGTKERRTKEQDAVRSTSIRTLLAHAREPIELEYDPALRIRGFSIAGGTRPGYLFEPADRPGAYRLVFETPGDYRVLVSSIRRDGWILIEDLTFKVEAATEDQETRRLEDFKAVERALEISRVDDAETPRTPRTSTMEPPSNPEGTIDAPSKSPSTSSSTTAPERTPTVEELRLIIPKYV